MKPFVLGVDLDGVCADYVSAFRAYVAERRGVSVDSIGPATDWAFYKVPSWPIADSIDYLQLHKDFATTRGFLTSPVIEGAREGLWELSNAGLYIRIVTHRLINSGSYASVIKQTAAWLDTNDLPFRGIAFERHKADVGCDLYIDDSPGNIEELREAGKRTIVFDAPYNKKAEGLRAHSWKKVVELVKGIANV